MDKQIKDYLHLYLGCGMIMSTDKWFKPEGDKIVIFRGLLDGGDYVSYQYDAPNEKTTGNFTYDNFKPILRPLSDMTDEEMNECGNLIYDFSDDKELNRWKWSDFDFGCAEQFHWLLSKHFDLFNLIPEGLAIDKTTLING